MCKKSTKKTTILTCGHQVRGKEWFPVANSDGTFWGSICGDCMQKFPGGLITSFSGSGRKLRTEYLHQFGNEKNEVAEFKMEAFLRRNVPSKIQLFYKKLPTFPQRLPVLRNILMHRIKQQFFKAFC